LDVDGKSKAVKAKSVTLNEQSTKEKKELSDSEMSGVPTLFGTAFVFVAGPGAGVLRRVSGKT
jgi:hypothetical protein